LTDLLNNTAFTKQELVELLSVEGEELELLYKKAAEVKLQHIGNKVYYRGLIEYSNRCAKNCFYCGVRRGNPHFERYELTDEEVLEAARLAHVKNFASLVIQSGERSSKQFVKKIAYLLEKIREMITWWQCALPYHAEPSLPVFARRGRWMTWLEIYYLSNNMTST